MKQFFYKIFKNLTIIGQFAFIFGCSIIICLILLSIHYYVSSDSFKQPGAWIIAPWVYFGFPCLIIAAIRDWCLGISNILFKNK